MKRNQLIFSKLLYWITIIFLISGITLEMVTITDADAASENTIEIGILTDLSGPIAFPGGEVLKGMETAIEEFNSKGILFGKDIESIIEDDESKPAVALRKAEKMVLTKKVKYIIGTVSSAVALALESKAPEWGIVYVPVGAKNQDITGKNWNKNTFRRSRNDGQDMMIIAEWLNQHQDLQKWYCIGSDYVWGRGNVQAFKGVAETEGRAIIGEVYPDLSNKDYGPQIVKILEKEPQAVWAALSGAPAIDFIKQAKSFGLSDKSKIVGVLLLPDQVVKAAGESAVGVYGNVYYSPKLENESNTNFIKRFEKKYGVIPTYFNAEGYMSALMLLNGIKKSGDGQVSKVIEAMEGMEFDTPLGKELVRKEDHQAIQTSFMGRVVKTEKGVEITIDSTFSREQGAVPIEKTGLNR